MDQLPVELLWEVWAFALPEDLRRLNAVCRRFRSVMPQFCAAAFRKRFSANYAPPVALTWLQLYTSTAMEEALKREVSPLSGEHLPVVEWAISKGFERFVQQRCVPGNPEWSRSLAVAIEQDQLDIVRILMRGAEPSCLGSQLVYPEAPTPIALAVQHGRVLILHEMLAVCPDADLTSLLIYAARTGSVNIVEYLHRRGANLDSTKIKVINGERLVTNALVEAVLHDHEEVSEYLVTNRACPDLSPDKHGDAPLVVAVQTHNLRLTMLLLMAGARTQISDVQGTPLMQLAAIYAPCIARLLVRVNGYRNNGQGLNNHNRKRRNSAPDGAVILKHAR